MSEAANGKDGEAEGFDVRIEHERDYAFEADFGRDDVPVLRMDEPPPLGEGGGPNASQALGAAVGNCLSASLLFCLRKSHVEPQGMHTHVSGRYTRNERGRLRIGGLDIDLEVEGVEPKRLARCTKLFEDFCVVTASVRQAIPVTVRVRAGAEVVYEGE